ncbi:unnamed protein product [Camellia sinensis]
MDKPNFSNQRGPTQRAEALAALTSAFKLSSGTKSGSASRPSVMGQGSQRAAAVAALSQVLTAEKKRSPESSPASGIKSENALSEVEDSKEDSEVKAKPPQNYIRNKYVKF